MIKSILYLLITILIIVIIVIKVRHHFKKIEKFAYGNYGIQCYYDKPFRISDNSILGQQSGDYHYLRFIYNGSGDERIYTLNLYADVLCDILIVGGGASGASAHGGIVGGSPNRGGGGGGGGVVYIINRILNAGTYKINVGRGGLPSSKDGKDSNIKNSDNSQVIIDGIELIGKGGGKPRGNLGGAGGGRDGGFQGLTFWDGEGYDYGGYNRSGGNGGGAGSSSGIGRDVNITNQIVHYGAGGKLGSGVGMVGNDGKANTGEGGGGAVGDLSTTQRYNGGYGGSGIVIIRFIMKENGVIYSCGLNDLGQLGLDSTESQKKTPTLIETYYNSSGEIINYSDIIITKISLGYKHSLFLTSEGRVYSCGWNKKGQLGFNSGDMDAGQDLNDGRYWDSQNYPYHTRPVLIETYYNSDLQPITYTNIKITKISTGFEHSLFLTSEGYVYSCGLNDLGQLGLDSTDTKKNIPTLIEKYYNSSGEFINYSDIIITKISLGYKHSLFLTSEGRVYSCGYNWNGQLGLGTNGWDNVNSVNKPTLIETYYDSDSEAINYDKIIITEISCGGDHSLFLTSEGYVYGCGYNWSGQLGLGNQFERKNPTLIHKYYDNTESVNYNMIRITEISSGLEHSLFLTSEDCVYSCGSNWNGQLGLGTGGEGTKETRPTLIETYYDSDSEAINYDKIIITKISSGGMHSLFLTSEGRAYSCGDNLNGQLGLGTNGEGNDKSSPTLIETYYYNSGKSRNYSNIRITEITANYYHSLFLYNYKN
jgi:alpha-tubulin suppressor-like RCC1 family protein